MSTHEHPPKRSLARVVKSGARFGGFTGFAIGATFASLLMLSIAMEIFSAPGQTINRILDGIVLIVCGLLFTSAIGAVVGGLVSGGLAAAGLCLDRLQQRASEDEAD